MQLSEEIRRIQQIIGVKLINEQTQSCPTLDEILKGEIDNVDISKYEYFKSGVIKDIAKSGWGPGTSEDESIKLLKDNIKNLDDLISFSNAWEGYISDNTKSTGWFGWENDLFNWVFNYETFAAYIKEEDDGNDIMSEMEPIWNGWITESCSKTYENTELEQDKYYIEYFNLNVINIFQYSHEKLVQTYDLNKVGPELQQGKVLGHGRFHWQIGFKVKPTPKYSMQSIKIIDNYTKNELFNCSELCNLPVALGKEYSNWFIYIQLGDFAKPWINCKIEFNNGETKEFTYGEITFNAEVVTTTTTKEINTKGNLVQNGRRIQIKQGTDKIKSIQVYTLDGKVVSTSTDLDFFLPNQSGTYFIVINYVDKKKKQSLVKVLYTSKKTSIASQEIN
jgi:hypothetical protein